MIKKSYKIYLFIKKIHIIADSKIIIFYLIISGLCLHFASSFFFFTTTLKSDNSWLTLISKTRVKYYSPT